MSTDKHDDVCTCGHLRAAHLFPPHPIDGTPVSLQCRCLSCACKRFDRRNFSDAELEQRRRDQFEELKRQRAEEPQSPPAAPAASTLERIAVALERIAGELQVLAEPVRRANPCPKGGRHQFTHEPLPDGGAKMDCARCGAKWAETEV